jgi:hypothetical protein
LLESRPDALSDKLVSAPASELLVEAVPEQLAMQVAAMNAHRGLFMVPSSYGPDPSLSRPRDKCAFDARPLALFRIALGAVLLQDLWCQASGLETFYTDDGLFPRGPTLMPWMWSLLHWSGSLLGVRLLFAAGALATLAFTVGAWIRLATAATWLFFVSLEHRVPEIHNGGDRLVAVLLFFGLFTDLSGRYSVDAVIRGPRAATHGLAAGLLAAAPLVLYAWTVCEKLRCAGPGWLDGSVLIANLHLSGWTRPGGVWLGEHPSLCTAAGIATVVVELAVPVLLLLPSSVKPARALGIVAHLSLQLGILLTFKVGVFTGAMLAATPLWLLPAWLDRCGGPFASRGSRELGSATRRLWGSSVIVVSLFAAMAVAPMMPDTAGRLLPWIGIDLDVGLFARPFPSIRWEAVGERQDGQIVDPLPPDADFTSGVRNSLWMQLPYRLARFAPLTRFVCRTYGSSSGARLLRWKLVKVTRPPYKPIAPPAEEARRTLVDQDCQVSGDGPRLNR